MINGITISFLLLGALITLLAAVGLLRFPDLFSRMHAASKSASLGVILLAVAAAMQIDGVIGVVKIVLIIGFIFLKSPVSAQALARAAQAPGEPAYNMKAPEEPPISAEKSSET
ncbi:MAG: monovalent cation/H(+) antiporter subunit G [Acidobacteriota bacterium]|nr:monovalent cation/H(+) antiporter subunit G [Acidobacteriota bacterium]